MGKILGDAEMKKFIIGIGITAILAFSCLVLAPAEEKNFQEVKDVQKDIQIINLLNNLDLRKEQIKFIIEKAREANDIREDALDKISACKSDMLDACSQIKQEVEAGKVIVGKEEKEAFSRMKHRMEYITKDAEVKIDRLAEEIEANLEQFQLMALDSYKPCIIPIMSKGRIGQSDASAGITKILEKVKSAPDLRYSRAEDKLVERLLEMAKNKAPGDYELNETKARQDILETFQEVRKMNEVDFQIQKSALAEELRNKVFPEKIALDRVEKIKRFLLSENVISVLEKRLK